MKLDLNLLKRLLVVNHPSKQEWPMISFIINECYRIGNLTFEMDSYANLFITKNTTNPDYFPCIVAHMDCVTACANKILHIKDNTIRGFDKLTNKQVGIGADDAVGICMALQLLKSIPNLKVCFTTEEEIGFLGAEAAADNIDFFYNVSYLLQADRYGKSDLITFTNGIYSASDKWLQEATGVMAKYGYSEATGLGTDIGVLAERLQLSGVNISCGYYKHHTNNEYVIIPEAQNCLNFMEALIKEISMEMQYEIKIDYKPYTSGYDYSKYDYERFYNDDTDYYGYDACAKCKNFDCMNCKIYPM